MGHDLKHLMRMNLRFAKQRWPGKLALHHRMSLRSLTQDYRFAVASGDLLFLDGSWYVTHAGLLRLAKRRGCIGIRVQEVREFCDSLAGRWVFKATLYKRGQSHGFVGFGDADPSNVSGLVRGAEMRIAETRAVNRALRKAYGIGLCSVEELGALATAPAARPSSTSSRSTDGSHSSNGNGQPRLRDQLCLLIRQYNLDANLVKQYAADFCGTETLRGASRELVESFIAHLSNAAKENRDALVCKLNSYARQAEV